MPADFCAGDMDELSVLTLAGGRPLHLRRMIDALTRSQLAPGELIIAQLDDADYSFDNVPFPIRIVRLLHDRLSEAVLPLAEARNRAASAARGRLLFFLDVDCMPSARALDAVATVLQRDDVTVCPEVLYLDAPVAEDWVQEDLERRSVPHPVRAFPRAGIYPEPNAGLLWSLAFGIRAATLQRIGGFDPGYNGYGAEDTDLGYAASAAGVPLMFLGGAPVFHQCHPFYDPPLQHFGDIIRNAKRFRDKWGRWPMEGWLHAFVTRGLIDWRLGAATLHIHRLPDAAEIAAARRPAGSPF